MAGRYKKFYGTYRNNDFVLWLTVSLAVHTVFATIIGLSPRTTQKVFHPRIYQVDLISRPDVLQPEEVVQNREAPPEVPVPRIEQKEKIKERAVMHRAVKKAKKGTTIPKKLKDTAKPDEAVAKLREKIAAEEAVERIRKKIKAKEAVSADRVKVAARPPARIYQYEELDAELRAYFEKISRIVRDSWSLPGDLRNKGFKTVLSININRDGTIESLWLEKGSGNKFYDESAFRAINKVNPLPPLPKAWKEESIDLGFNF